MSTAVKKAGRVHVKVTAEVNITARIARRLVNTELMQKVGQMIMAGEPELLVDGQRSSGKLPCSLFPLNMAAQIIRPAGTHWSMPSADSIS